MTDITENAKAMVWSSFAADSLALGAHWIYDVGQIERLFGRVDQLKAPPSTSFHAGKHRGDLTHYGDQMIVLLESIATQSGFDLDRFAHDWQQLFKTYDGYVDGATRTALAHFRAGSGPDLSGSDSSDLGGAARIAPLVFRYYRDTERLIGCVRTQTAMTHNHPHTMAAAVFFARVTAEVLTGTSPLKAVSSVSGSFTAGEAPIDHWVAQGIESAGMETTRAIAAFGQMCDTRAAFPGVIHLIARYETDLKTALVENIMAGGDSAARGMTVAMILGAHLGPGAIPAEWQNGLRQQSQIEALIDRIGATGE